MRSSEVIVRLGAWPFTMRRETGEDKEDAVMYLSGKVSNARLREAENARRNRAEILKALADGTISRRDLIKWGLFTVAGGLALKGGLSPFAGSAYADSIPTGAPPSPLFGVQPFTQPMPRFDVLPRFPEPGFLNTRADGPGQHHSATPEHRAGGGEPG